MYFKVLFVVGLMLPEISSDIVDLNSLKCKGQNSPAHGSLTCHEDTTTKEVSCTLKCDHGYDVEFLAAERYVCNTDGTWRAQPLSTGSRWPNCKKYSRGEPIP
ncbi:sushi, von Willebrand factor type A, EGF and pentraxin domain-containing protein 1-like [Pocillopora damicornis]|uniref:sushi, von Willebrand factor type A, EGF and pentraxin domain-containing protein 1-like n=1 Tax=Pocillopora damicornis TaxID=46731 RepID=UPI000F550A84|nr:sushi, von Willebrand factor type A, EGF and pentraxin domain-containing protein 1-like [Pocillopora damicornis]